VFSFYGYTFGWPFLYLLSVRFGMGKAYWGKGISEAIRPTIFAPYHCHLMPFVYWVKLKTALILWRPKFGTCQMGNFIPQGLLGPNLSRLGPVVFMLMWRVSAGGWAAVWCRSFEVCSGL